MKKLGLGLGLLTAFGLVNLCEAASVENCETCEFPTRGFYSDIEETLDAEDLKDYDRKELVNEIELKQVQIRQLQKDLELNLRIVDKSELYAFLNWTSSLVMDTVAVSAAGVGVGVFNQLGREHLAKLEQLSKTNLEAYSRGIEVNTFDLDMMNKIGFLKFEPNGLFKFQGAFEKLPVPEQERIFNEAVRRVGNETRTQVRIFSSMKLLAIPVIIGGMVHMYYTFKEAGGPVHEVKVLTGEDRDHAIETLKRLNTDLEAVKVELQKRPEEIAS